MNGVDTKPKPTCPDCGRIMQLVRTIPGRGIAPELPTYGCRWCANAEIEGHEPGERELAK